MSWSAHIAVRGATSRRAGLLLLVAALLASLTPAHAISAPEQSMLDLVNETRTAEGRVELRISESLSDIARQHSERMASRGALYDYPNLEERLRNYEWEVVGANVGAGPTIGAVHDAFMRSQSHRDNILLYRFRRIGVGIVRADGRYWVTEIFLG